MEEVDNRTPKERGEQELRLWIKEESEKLAAMDQTLAQVVQLEAARERQEALVVRLTALYGLWYSEE